MQSKYKITVNGEFKTMVMANEGTDFDTFRAFAKAYIPEYNVSNDTLEIECVDVLAQIIPFRTSAYMQVSEFAVEAHIRNLVLTYGLDMVKDVLVKQLHKAA